MSIIKQCQEYILLKFKEYAGHYLHVLKTFNSVFPLNIYFHGPKEFNGL
jgi:hypothetical protein